ncbi:MAG TPA: HdeD family acid-resistance protein [Ktedonobacterales bacterium]|nr:HdeD family acid-resistance protein [Ktedonobacterales bacterium]
MSNFDMGAGNPDFQANYARARAQTLASRTKWSLILRGILAIIFGIVVWVWPHITLLVLIAMFGIFAVISGIFALGAAFQAFRAHHGWWLLALSGVLCIAAGIVALVWPRETALILLFVIAIWAIVTGIVEIAAAFTPGRTAVDEWLMVLGGILSIIFGILLFIFPRVGLLALVWLIGIYAILYGISLITSAFAIGGLQRSMRRGPTAPAA